MSKRGDELRGTADRCRELAEEKPWARTHYEGVAKDWERTAKWADRNGPGRGRVVTELRIPPAAEAVAAVAAGLPAAHLNALLDGVHAAAPLIAAAELTRIADEISELYYGVSYRREVLDILYGRANELADGAS